MEDLLFNLERIVFVLKIVSINISFFLLALIVFLASKLIQQNKQPIQALVEAQTVSSEDEASQDKTWQKLFDKIQIEDESSFKMAIIEADQILDSLLIKKGFKGADMGERLKQVTANQIPNLDAVWQAHKLRNRIAHESNVKLTQQQARQALEIYQRAVQDLAE